MLAQISNISYFILFELILYVLHTIKYTSIVSIQVVSSEKKLKEKGVRDRFEFKNIFRILL